MHSNEPVDVMDTKHVAQHQASFDRIYAKLPAEDPSFDFPLAQRDSFDFGRGEYRNPFQRYQARRFNVHYLGKLQIASGMSVLSLGCGRGYDARNISKLYTNIDQWGVDISHEMVSRALQGGSPGNFSVACAEALPFPDNCFDRVLSVEVIEHVMNQQGMLDEIYRVLTPGGIAVVTTENEESLAPTNRFAEAMRNRICRLGGVILASPSYQDEAPSKKEFRFMCRNSGLQLLELFYDGALYQTLPRFPSLLRGEVLTRMAHYASALENNTFFAHLFCDQIKYVVQKTASDTGRTSPRYVAPGGDRSLTLEEDSYKDVETGCSYPLINGAPCFTLQGEASLADSSEQSKPSSQAPSDEPSKPVRAWRKSWLRFANWFVYKAYAGCILFAGMAAALGCPSNKERLTRNLPEGDRLLKYIKL